MLDFLSETDREIIAKQKASLEEVRIRLGQKAKAVFSAKGKRYVVSLENIYDGNLIEEIVYKLCDYSPFCKEESIRQCFVTSKSGERAGICGTIVYDGEKVVTVKDVTSLCLRFPNEVIGLTEGFAERYLNGVESCLVISPPFGGKTTFLRDLGRIYSDKYDKNVLYIDEREEFSGNGKFYLGKNADVLKNSSKEYGFKNGVRTLNPDVIVCDELMNEEDLSAVAYASASGVKTISSAHSDNLKNLLKKPHFKEIFKLFTFQKYVELSYGKILNVYDEEGRKC